MDFDPQKEKSILEDLAHEMYKEGPGEYQTEQKIFEELKPFENNDVFFSQVNNKLAKDYDLEITLKHAAVDSHRLLTITIGTDFRVVETLDLTTGIGAKSFYERYPEPFVIDTSNSSPTEKCDMRN